MLRGLRVFVVMQRLLGEEHFKANFAGINIVARLFLSLLFLGHRPLDLIEIFALVLLELRLVSDEVVVGDEGFRTDVALVFESR